MAGLRSTGDPRRPHDRLWTLYAGAYETLEAMGEEIDSLIEGGEMDGNPAEDMAAREWAARLDELKGMAGELAMRIDGSGVGADKPDASAADVRPGASGGVAEPRQHSGSWRERLNRVRQSSPRYAGRRADPGGES